MPAGDRPPARPPRLRPPFIVAIAIVALGLSLVVWWMGIALIGFGVLFYLLTTYAPWLWFFH